MSDIIRRALRQAKAALEHSDADCWASGPRTGNYVEDFIICPGCRAIHSIDLAFEELDKGETKNGIQI